MQTGADMSSLSDAFNKNQNNFNLFIMTMGLMNVVFAVVLFLENKGKLKRLMITNLILACTIFLFVLLPM